MLKGRVFVLNKQKRGPPSNTPSPKGCSVQSWLKRKKANYLFTQERFFPFLAIVGRPGALRTSGHIYRKGWL